MTLAVTDVRGGADRQINEAAKALGQASQRRAIFRQIHSGRKRTKTVQEIADAIHLPRKRVLEEGIKLVHKQIIKKTSRDGETAYERDNFYYVHREEILRRAGRLKSVDRPPVAPSSPRHGGPERKAPGAVNRRSVRRSSGRVSRPCDVFLSHASEDKTAIARPLFEALKGAGLKVWFDEAELTMGDSLRRHIDRGLARCRFGVVILSAKFFAKDWPQQELDGLVARENASGQKTILPVWHKLTKAKVARHSPMLADRLAANSKDGVGSVVSQIVAALNAAPRGAK